MSDKQFEPCTFTEATHVEINKVVYQIVGNICTYNIGLRWLEEDVWIPIELFHILGIKPLKEIKPLVRRLALYSLDDGVSYQNCKKARFKCVEILEEKK